MNENDDGISIFLVVVVVAHTNYSSDDNILGVLLSLPFFFLYSTTREKVTSVGCEHCTVCG